MPREDGVVHPGRAGGSYIAVTNVTTALNAREVEAESSTLARQAHSPPFDLVRIIAPPRIEPDSRS